MVESEFSEIRFEGDKKKAEKAYAGYRPLQPIDIAESIIWAIEQPPRVNIDNIEIMPTDQTYAGAKTTASL
jgi:NADP-dependent 3-hydroxy acid dehydrogenase YdfG